MDRLDERERRRMLREQRMTGTMREETQELLDYDVEGAGSERRAERERRKSAKMERELARQAEQEREDIQLTRVCSAGSCSAGSCGAGGCCKGSCGAGSCCA